MSFLDSLGLEVPISSAHPLQIIEGGFVNLTTLVVDDRMAALLSFGPDFCVPHSSKVVNIFSTFNMLNRNMVLDMGVPDPTVFFREMFTSHYNELQAILTHVEFSHSDLLVADAVRVTRSFFLRYPTVCVVQADKGRRTVLMYTTDYHLKMQSYVAKCVTVGVFSIPGSVPSRLKVVMAAYERLRRQLLRVFDSVSDSDNKPFPHALYNGLLKGSSSFPFSWPVLYGTMKCHKPDVPVRPICATHSWYSQPIQRLLVFFMKKMFSGKQCVENVSNIDLLCRDLVGLDVPPGFVFVKYDVRDMYPSMPRDDVSDFLGLLVRQYCAENSNFPLSATLLQCMLHFSLETSSFVAYQGQVYAQSSGLPQGACDSGLYATYYLDFQLQLHHESLFVNHKVIFWRKYMDDILLCMPGNLVESFKAQFELVTRLKLELEGEEEVGGVDVIDGVGIMGRLSYLDMWVMRCESSVMLSMYRKPCASSRMIHFLSDTLPDYKVSTITQYVSKVVRRVDTQFLLVDLSHLEQKFYSNGYPHLVVAKIMGGVLRSEISLIMGGTSFRSFSPGQQLVRANVISDFLRRFPVVSRRVISRGKISKKRKNFRGRISVYTYHGMSLCRFLTSVHRYYGLSVPVFSRGDSSYSLLRVVSAQRISRLGLIPLTDNSLQIGMVSCSVCRMTFIIAGYGVLSDRLSQCVADSSSDLYRHSQVYGHRIGEAIFSLRPFPRVSASMQINLFAALYNASGLSCGNRIVLSDLPSFVVGFFRLLTGLSDSLPIGIPVPP